MNRPEESSILTSIQELVIAYENENFSLVIEKCNNLLKRKKSLDSPIVDAVERLLLQSYLQRKDYGNVREYGRKFPQQHRDLVLYAHYRQEEYDVVSQQASKNTTLEQHLLAQSYYHLNQVNPSIRVYQEMLNDDESLDVERRMEVLTNALSVFCTTVVPYVKNESPLLKQAQDFLEDHPDTYGDLSFNVGTVQCLTGYPPSSSSSSSSNLWLEVAKDLCGDDNVEDLIPIEINTQWSQQFWHTGTMNNDSLNYDTEQGSAPQKAVAQINQALIDHRLLPTQPNPKWNSIQIQLYWYNRAVQQYQSQQYVQCTESCQSLRKTFVGNHNKRNSKGLTSSNDWWWQCRLDVLLAYVQKDQGKVDAGITRLEERLREIQKQECNNIIDHATAYIQLHLQALQSPNLSYEGKKTLLKSLPSSIQSKPAVILTLEALDKAIQTSAVTASSSGTSSTKRSPIDEANVLFDQGQYMEAIKLYEEYLPSPESCTEQKQLFDHLKHVQALAFIGKYEASSELMEIVTPLLEYPMEDPSSSSMTMLKGESLENKALPRTSSSSSSTSTKTLSAVVVPPNGNGGSMGEMKSKRTKEQMLRERARQKEIYLKSLEEKGIYNPNQPIKPDPERWIPKHERNRARRRGQNMNSRSAQGYGGGGGGLSQNQADIQKLDAAARRAGHVQPSTGPSTANLKVSSAGGPRKARGRR